MGCYRQEWLNAARCLEDGPSEFCQFAGLTHLRFRDLRLSCCDLLRFIAQGNF